MVVIDRLLANWMKYVLMNMFIKNICYSESVFIIYKVSKTD